MARMTSKLRTLWRLSILELLLLVGFAAVACASLLNASVLWVSIILSITCLCTLLLAILAICERGVRQAAALSSLAALFLYGLLWTFEPPMNEITDRISAQGPDGGVEYKHYLPSTHLLNAAWDRVNGTYAINILTGEVGERLSDDVVTFESGYMGPNLPPGWNFNNTVRRAWPRPEHFVGIGHCLFAMALAYISGKLAAFIYLRRLVREQSAPTDEA